MSNNVNQELFERAGICVSYFEGKLPAKLIQKDLDNNDLENLHYHVLEAEKTMFDLEFNPEPITPETINVWGESIVGDNDVF